jgi:hypothetical protein
VARPMIALDRGIAPLRRKAHAPVASYPRKEVDSLSVNSWIKWSSVLQCAPINADHIPSRKPLNSLQGRLLMAIASPLQVLPKSPLNP